MLCKIYYRKQAFSVCLLLVEKSIFQRGMILYTLPLREYMQDHQVELSGAPEFIENDFEKGF